MSFDKTDAAHLLALKNEVNNDPLGIGYAAVVQSTQQLLNLLNDPVNNLGGETVNVKLTPRVLLDSLVVADFSGNQVTDGERRYLEVFLNKPYDDDIEMYREKIRQTFKVNSSTVNALDALIRVVSRAEVLFGVETVITRDDWIAARES